MKGIVAENLIPVPLTGIFNSESDVWGKNIVFAQGAYYHINAPSGTGKTTLIHIFCGLRNDYAGRLLMGNEIMSGEDQHVWSLYRRNRLSVIYQDLRLFEDLSAIDNIQLRANLAHENRMDEIPDWASQLGVERVMHKKINQLSRGERQRVAIMRALVTPFQWLFMDEPFSHLDEDNSWKAARLIDSVVKENEAGLLMANLYEDNFFNYHQRLRL